MQGYVKVMRLEWKLRWLERAMIEETKPIPWLQNLRIGCWCLCVLLRKYMFYVGNVCVVEGFIWFGFGTVKGRKSLILLK